MKLLEEYIKHIITEQQNSSNILQAIVNKFSEYATFVPVLISAARAADEVATLTAINKRTAFLKRYREDEAFKKQISSLYVHNRTMHFDFVLITPELREFLQEDLKSAEMVVIERNKVSAVKIEDVHNALEIAESVEEFVEMVRMSAITEQHIDRKIIIIQESIDRRLKLNTIISKASKIIMNELKKLVTSPEDRYTFVINENQIQELKSFVYYDEQVDSSHTLYIQVRLKKNTDVRQKSGEYHRRENKITLDLSFKKEDDIKKYLSLVIRQLQDTLRHELEHVIQFLVKHERHSGALFTNYHERQFEIEAYAVMVYKRVLKYANAHKIKLDKVKIVKVVSNFINKEFHDIASDQRDTLTTKIIDYMKKRYSIVNQMDMTA